MTLVQKVSLLVFLSTFTFSAAIHGQTVRTITDGFSASGGVRVDSDGNILVADFGADFSTPGMQLYKITPEGGVSVFSTALLGGTGGNFDSNAVLYWSSFGANRVDKIDGNGAATFFATVSGPVAIALDASDNLFVASCNTNSIVRITPQGQTSTFATGNLFNCANGLTIDDAGTLYVSNFNNGLVTQVSTTGQVSSFATVPGNNSVNLAFNDGFVYVTARAIHGIYRIPVDGNPEPELFAGMPGVRGNDDGPALEATFSFPNGIAASPDGTTLYTNDVAVSSSTFHPSVLRAIDLGNATSVDGPGARQPETFALRQNYPNPFNPTTTIRYTLSEAILVELRIYNTLGQEIRTLVSEIQAPGAKSVRWDGRDDIGQKVSSGLYIYRIKAGTLTDSRKMLLMR
jgi:sugar lactone lactonase YvrE